MEPVLERSFVAESFANRKGKGTHLALAQAQTLARRFPYVLQIDLVQFFPSIDHAILRAQIARRVTDPGVLWLVDLILASEEGDTVGLRRVTFAAVPPEIRAEARRILSPVRDR